MGNMETLFYRPKYYESRTISIHNVKNKAKYNNLNSADSNSDKIMKTNKQSK